MTATMRAAMLRGREDVAVVDVPVPSPGPGEVVLRIEAALTCGTDAKVFRRGYHARMLTPPCLFGHEYTGIVEAAGAGVTDFREGDPVVGANSAPCGACEQCKRGRESLCDDLTFVNGAFAERLLLPERIVRRNLYHRFPGLAPSVAAATEPVSCVLKGVEAVAPQTGESALLLGSGPVALVFAAALRARGVESVVLARSADAAPVAAQMGAQRCVAAPSVAVARPEILAASPGGKGYDLVVEAAGAAETSEAAPTLCRKGGRVLLFGGCPGDARMTVDPSRLHYDEIQILSSFHHTPRHVHAALDALTTGALRIEPLLESPVGLDGVPDALRRMCRRELRGKVPVLPGTAAT
jgi:L-iditol 2-dehydrogenase